MPFAKGKPKTGGKKKGFRSFKLAEVLRAHSFAPIEELLKIYPTLPDKDKAKVCMELQSYLEAKPKPEPVVDEFGNMSTKELVIYVKEKIPELLPASPSAIDEETT